MFERFTPQARQVVIRAQAETRTLGHGSIGTEHELLALVGELDGVAAEIFSELAITTEAVREQVTARLGARSGEPTQGQIPFTPQAKKVLELSLRESLALGHVHIGPSTFCSRSPAYGRVAGVRSWPRWELMTSGFAPKCEGWSHRRSRESRRRRPARAIRPGRAMRPLEPPPVGRGPLLALGSQRCLIRPSGECCVDGHRRW